MSKAKIYSSYLQSGLPSKDNGYHKFFWPLKIQVLLELCKTAGVSGTRYERPSACH
jgi:hypothetical protein